MSDVIEKAPGGFFERERLISIDTLAQFLEISSNAVRCMKIKGKLPTPVPGLGRTIRWRFGDILDHFGQGEDA